MVLKRNIDGYCEKVISDKKKFEQSHSAKTLERGDTSGFFNIHSAANYQKFEGDFRKL